MVPDYVSKQPYSWRCGYYAGTWTRTERDKLPPKNPIDPNRPEWQQWEEGFKAAKEDREQ